MKKVHYRDGVKKNRTFCTQADKEAENWRDRQLQFYGSMAWKNLREYVLSERGGLCERCRKAGKYRAAEVVHHRIPLGPDNVNDPDIALNPKNLECLCRDCHAAVHSSRRHMFDEYGNVVII